MPRAVDGTYETPNNSVAPAVASTTIDPDDFNTLVTDIETAISEAPYTSAGLGSTDNRLTRTDGTNGKKLQGSAIGVDDSGNLSGLGYVDIGEIATPGSPASNTARLYCVDSSGTTKLAYKDASGTVTTIETAAGAGSPTVPQGRLTLTSATPLLTATVSGATTIYYAPYTGRYVPLYSGSAWSMVDFGGELSQATTDTTKSPAACTTNSNYDLFVWDDSGTYRCTRGPAWSSDTARGTGAGTTELERVAGAYVNKVAITNGPAAHRGTYVGTIRTNGSSQVDFILSGTAATGGTAGFVGLCNAYNAVPWSITVMDDTNSWSYTTTTVRQANNSSAMRVSFVVADAGTHDIRATYIGVASTTTSGPRVGVGYDSTSAFSGAVGIFGATSGVVFPSIGSYARQAALGFHYLAALERGNTGVTFYGDNSTPLDTQAGFIVSGMY